MGLVYWKCRNCGVYLPGEKLILNHHKYWKHDKKPKHHFHPEKDRDEWERMEFREAKVTLKSLMNEDISDLEFEEDYDPNEDLEQDEELQTKRTRISQRIVLTAKESVRCDKCFVRIKYSRNLNRHMRIVHGIKNPPLRIQPGIKCPFCIFRTNSSIALATHMGKFHPLEKQQVNRAPENTLFQKQEFQCYDCPSKFPTQTKLFLHRRKDHIGERPHKCPHCPEVALQKESAYKIHMLRHSDRWEVLKKDPKLLEVEKRKIVNERRKFRMAIYNRPLNYKCPHCPRAFHAKGILQNHIYTHTKEKWFKCTTCGSSYSRKYKLDEHIKLGKCEEVIAEAATKLASCDLCSVRLKNQKRLMIHIRTQHIIKNPRIKAKVICAFCGYRAKGPQGLERHMTTHTGEKPFLCEACGSRFARSSNMHRHMQLSCSFAKNSGLAAKYVLPKKPKCSSSRTYKCDPVKCLECNELLPTTPGIFNIHQAIHGTAYKCPHCPAGYQKKMGLSFHLKRSHPETVPGEECEFCGKKFRSLSQMKQHCQHVHEVNIGSERELERLEIETGGGSQNQEDFLESEDSVEVKLEFESENEDMEYENILEYDGGKSRALLKDNEEIEDFLNEECSIEVKVEDDTTEEDYQDYDY